MSEAHPPTLISVRVAYVDVEVLSLERWLEPDSQLKHNPLIYNSQFSLIYIPCN